MLSNPAKWKAWRPGDTGIYCSSKVPCAVCPLSCFLAKACHWRCFTAEVISLLLFPHHRRYSVINTYCHSHPICSFPLSLMSSSSLFVLHLALNYTVEGMMRGESIDCVAALCLLCPFSSSPDSTQLAAVRRVATDRTCWIKSPLWTARLLAQLKLTVVLFNLKLCFMV